MGREIRRVPPHWEHPRRDCPHSPWQGGCDDAKAHGGKCYQPLYDEDVESAWADWQSEYAKWLAGEHARVIAEYGEEEHHKDEPYRAFCEWHGEPPNPDYYRPKWDEGTATWWQVYQTVSEGSPVTPAFATAEELVDYLCEHGDYWAQSRGERLPSREAATAFVKSGWVPSMMVTHDDSGVTIKEGIDCAL